MTDGTYDPSEGLGEAAALVARGIRRAALAPTWIALLAMGLDVPALSTALWFAQYASIAASEFSPVWAASDAILAATAASVTLACGRGYSPAALRLAGRSIPSAIAALAMPVVLLALTLPDASRGPFALSAGVALLAVCLPTRLVGGALARWLMETRLLDRRAVVAGGGDNAERLIRGLTSRPGNDIRIHGLFDDRDDTRSPIQILSVPKLGGYEQLVRFVRASEIDMVIISLPLEAESRIDWLLEAFKVLPVDVRLSAFSRGYAFAPSDPDPLISAIRRSFTPDVRFAKRVLDLAFASMALVVLAPIMLVAAIAIRLDSPGPVFFRQKRHGYNDRVIEVLKFRSLFHEAADPSARKIVTRDDPRVTRVGRFLRRSSIDELPQIFNVLKGDLSLVGPRPHAVDAMSSDQQRFTRIVKGYSARHRLPPGITGWAQINGWRGEIDAPDKLHSRFEHDLFYIENWSIWLDIEILLRTPFCLFGGNAY